MTDDKKKGDFQRTSGQAADIGGNKKEHAKPESASRTAAKQSAAGGTRNVGRDG